MEDERIIGLFNERSEEAIEALKTKYGSRAAAVAVNILGNAQDAEETVSDAIHTLWQRIPPEQPVHLWAYFSRILRNICCDRLDYRNAQCRASAAEVCLSELADCVSPGGDPQELLEKKMITDQINAFLEDLDSSNRTIFVRRYYYFDSCAEIAKRIGMGRGTVNTRLHRLRQQLRDALEKEEIFV